MFGLIRRQCLRQKTDVMTAPASMKTFLRLGFFLLGVVSVSATSAQSQASQKATPSMTLEEIAALKSIAKVEQLAKGRNIPYEIQTNETMRARLVPEYNQSISFVAVGRLCLTFWLHKENDMVTVHVSFFHDKRGHILGRVIFLENNNVP
jgi:hypothetical protein